MLAYPSYHATTLHSLRPPIAENSLKKQKNLCQQEQSTSCASYHPQFLTEREAASDIGFRLALGGQTTNCRVITLMPSPISNLEVALVGINRIQQLFHPLIQVFDRQTHYV